MSRSGRNFATSTLPRPESNWIGNASRRDVTPADTLLLAGKSTLWPVSEFLAWSEEPGVPWVAKGLPLVISLAN